MASADGAGEDEVFVEMGRVMRGRRRRRGALLWVALLASAALVGLPFLLARAADPPPAPPPPSPTEPAESVVTRVGTRFLRAWQRENWTRLQQLTVDQSLDAAAVHRRTHDQLRITGARFTPEEAEVEVLGDTATLPYEGTWELEGLEPYGYRGELRLVRSDDADEGWAVRWWYSTVHPELTEKTTLERTRVFPRRARILSYDGKPLATTREVVVVGIQPARVDSRRDVVAALRDLTDARPVDVRRLLRRDDLEDLGFYEVTQLTPARFEAVRPQLFPVKGLVFRREQQRRRPNDVGSALVGSMGEASAEQLERLGEPYRGGDRVGQGGLERVFEKRLAGEPAYEAAITDDVGLVRSLGFKPGKPARGIRTTLSVRIQRAAERALRQAPAPAALVAIDARSGAVRGAAHTPADGFNRALSGVYPPGSTFKVVTAQAALDDGLRQRTRVRCPARIKVGNGRIGNAGGARYGRVTLRRAFAQSCNTTFARVGMRVGADDLTAAARLFGFNSELDFTLPAAGGEFPRPASDPELARASIGQAQIETSPLHMASVAATVASGRYRPPTLLARDEPEPGPALGGRIRRQLHGMMREVVRSGTGTAARVRGAQVAGKTGSAQFSGGERTHAWFIGFRDDLAFAVIVERGGGGGAVAAPVARDFLQRLDG